MCIRDVTQSLTTEVVLQMTIWRTLTLNLFLVGQGGNLSRTLALHEQVWTALVTVFLKIKMQEIPVGVM